MTFRLPAHEKGYTLKGKNFLPRASKLFPLRVNAFSERNPVLIELKVYPFLLMVIQKKKKKKKKKKERKKKECTYLMLKEVIH